MAVIRHGEMVYSAEWNGYKSDDQVHVASVTKSIVALLIGIAMDKGMLPLDFANEFLFQPLSIEQRGMFYAETEQKHKEFIISKAPKEKVWLVDPHNIPAAGFGLCLSANEMAKIGQLCLTGGVYDDRRIISKEWITQITEPSSPKMDAFGGMQYGMLWWTPDLERGIYAASGTGGNVIYVNPELDAVVAVSATFKPTVFDRIPFIEKNVIPLL